MHSAFFTLAHYTQTLIFPHSGLQLHNRKQPCHSKVCYGTSSAAYAPIVLPRICSVLADVLFMFETWACNDLWQWYTAVAAALGPWVVKFQSVYLCHNDAIHKLQLKLTSKKGEIMKVLQNCTFCCVNPVWSHCIILIFLLYCNSLRSCTVEIEIFWIVLNMFLYYYCGPCYFV